MLPLDVQELGLPQFAWVEILDLFVYGMVVSKRVLPLQTHQFNIDSIL